MSELRRYEATLVHKRGENPYMVMASAEDGDYCEYQQAADEITRLRQLLSEAEKREKEAKRIAVNAETYGYGHGLEAADQICAKALCEGSPIHPIAVKYITGIRNALSALQSEER